MFFISLWKLFSFSGKSNFSILDIQISWGHQMPKHKTEKYILLKNLGSKQPFNEIWPVYVLLQKKKIYWKILQKLRPEN